MIPDVQIAIQELHVRATTDMVLTKHLYFMLDKLFATVIDHANKLVADEAVAAVLTPGFDIRLRSPADRYTIIAAVDPCRE